MSILVGEHTRMATAGITGREGTFHTRWAEEGRPQEER